MRWVLRAILTIVVLWLGYWFGVKYLLDEMVDKNLAQWRANGLYAQAQSSVTGFPARFNLILQDVEIHDPLTGDGWKTDQAHLYAVAWRPWHLIAALPPQQSLTYDGQTYEVRSTALRGSLRLRPNLDLALSDLRVTADQLHLRGDQGMDLSIGPMIFALREAGGTTYQFGADIAQIRPDPALMALLTRNSQTQTLPAQIDKITARVMLDLTAPLNKDLGEAPLGIAALQVEDFALIWGDLTLGATGAIRADPMGLAQGQITLNVTGWQALPPLLVSAGVIPQQYAGLLTQFLRVMAAQNESQALKVDLIAKEGRLSLGPLSLGPAPRLLP